MKNKNYLIKIFSNNIIKIVFFGSRHREDLEQINKIREIISDFNPEIVLIEGGFENADFSSEEEAIQNGESGFTCFLAKSKNIVVKGNDPSNSDQINFLMKSYDKNLIFAYFILRKLSQTQDKKLIKKYIDNFKHLTNWKNFDYTPKNLIINIKTILGKDITEITKDYFNPYLDISYFNEVTKELSEFRDNYMINLLKNLINSYKKIFIIKGKSHLLKQGQDIANFIK